MEQKEEKQYRPMRYERGRTYVNVSLEKRFSCLFRHITSYFFLQPTINPYAVLNNIPQQVRVFVKNSEIKLYLHAKLPEQNIFAREDFYLNEVRCYFLASFFIITTFSSFCLHVGFDAFKGHHEPRASLRPTKHIYGAL